MPSSVVDERGRVEIPKEVRKRMGVMAGDVLLWVPLGSSALVTRRRGKAGREEVRERLEKLRAKAPECFAVGVEDLPPLEAASEALREWAMSKLGLKE